MGFWTRPPDDTDPTPPVPDRHGRATAAAYGAPRAITASAERITLANAVDNRRPYLQWQRDAWVAYERVGEIHFGFNLEANLISRVRFFGAVVGAINEPPTDVDAPSVKGAIPAKLRTAVKDLMHELFLADGVGLLRTFALNLSVPGECYLIELPATSTQPSRWAVRSVNEVQVRGDTSAVLKTRRDGGQQTTLPAGTYIARIWRRHPQYSTEPDSSMLGVADSVEELLMLQRLVRSATRSRLNAGMLFVPEGVASAINPKKTAEPVIDEPTDDNDFSSLRASSTSDPSGKFLADLMESMTTPITQESSASSVVPMLVVGPGEQGQQIRHITFERSSDAWLVDRIEKVLERILQGIDMPKEIITGMSNVKYSNAVVIDEGMYKANIEPLALTVADAFTSVYLVPRLTALGFSQEDIAKVVVWYDPTEIVTRPGRFDEASNGVDRGVLSSAAWRREHGYSETDAATEEDKAHLLLSKISVLPPDALVQLLRKAYPTLLGDLPMPPVVPTPPGEQPPSNPDGVPSADPTRNVTQLHPSTPPADAQRTAIKQVGVR